MLSVRAVIRALSDFRTLRVGWYTVWKVARAKFDAEYFTAGQQEQNKKIE